TIRAVRQQEADLLEGFPDGPDPVAERVPRPQVAAEPAGGGLHGQAPAEPLGIVGNVTGLDLSAREDVVPGRELALRMALNQKGFYIAVGSVAEEGQGRGRRRNGGRAHGRAAALCHRPAGRVQGRGARTAAARANGPPFLFLTPRGDLAKLA